MSEIDNKGFLLQLYMKAEQKQQEYVALLNEKRRLEMRAERTKEYVEELNKFIKSEEQKRGN